MVFRGRYTSEYLFFRFLILHTTLKMAQEVAQEVPPEVAHNARLWKSKKKCMDFLSSERHILFRN